MFSGKLLTARQRAMTEGDGMGELMSLPMNTEMKTKRQKKVLTEEQQQRQAEVKEQRRLAYIELQDKEKRDTISKLLQKQTKDKSKDKGSKTRKASEISQAPPATTVILYRSVISGGKLCNTVSIPRGLGLPPCFAKSDTST